jgi:cytochrome c oxidase assembly factor CtaG
MVNVHLIARYTVHGFLARARPGLVFAALLLALGVAMPPMGSYARHYAFVQALQFVTFAIAVPMLLVLGLRPRSAGSFKHAPGLRRLAERPVPAGLPTSRTVAARLLPFIALAIAWRLPFTLDALARSPAWTAAEMVTLIGAGSGLWLELAGTPPPRQRLPRPARAAMAAVAMWTIWVMAYVTGMSLTAVAAGHGQAAARSLSAAADRQIAAAVMWAVPAICFAPVVYGMLIMWLGERDDPGPELRTTVFDDSAFDGLGRSLRPPRGWRSPPGRPRP